MPLRAKRNETEISGRGNALLGSGPETAPATRALGLVLTSTEDAANHVDFNDLVTAGCAIPDTARRGISLDQLERIMVHVRRRLVDEREVWMVWNPQEQKKSRQLTSPDDVTLYDLNDYCIRAATMDQKTSLVERLAREEQTPDYFVSQ